MASFRVGDIVTVSLPFVFTLNSEERGNRCDFCFRDSRSTTRPPNSLKRCSCCKLTFYCDVKCQRSAWKCFHKDECQKLSSFTPEKCPTESFIFFARLARKVFKGSGMNETEEVLGNKRSFENLKSHVEDIQEDTNRKFQLKRLDRFLSLFFPDIKYNSNELMLLYGKMVVNTYTIYDPELKEIGTGLYLGASIFDHSCDPNAVAVFNGTSLIIRAIKSIDRASYKNIFIHYVDPIDPTAQRQDNLRKGYYFTCLCSSCLNSDMDRIKTDVLDKDKSSELISSCSQFLNDATKRRRSLTANEKELLGMCRTKLNQVEGVLCNGHVTRIRMLILASELCIDLELWEECLQFSRSAMEYLSVYYNHYNPTFGLQIFKVGKLQHLLGHLQEASQSLLEARRLLSICYGKEHEHVKELDSLLVQCQAEIIVNQ